MLARKTARRGDNYYRSLLEVSSEGLVVTDASGLVLDATGSFLELAGSDGQGLSGCSFGDFLHPDDGPKAHAAIASAAGAGAGALLRPHRWRLRGPGGSWLYVDVALHDRTDDRGVRGVVLTVRDVTRATMLEQRLRDDAFRDALTGLGNRVMLLDRVRIALSRRPAGAQVAILFLDLDNFKQVNDTRGHHAGDELLVGIAQRLRECLRPGDAATRLGGDEFAIVLEGISEPDQAGQVAQRILESFRTPLLVGGARLRAQTSIGIGISEPTGEQSAEKLVRDADVAMYVAKERGKGRFEYFDAHMRAGTIEQMELKDALEGAIERGDFVLQYQPVIDLRSGEVVGAEALLRWRDRHRGMIPPGRFIGIAEEAGLMDTIGRWVVRQAVEQMRRWQAASGRPLRVNVNLSARQLDQPGLSEEIGAVLSETGMDAQSLVVEITEQVFMQDSEHVLVNLQGLKELGVRLAIDDFGTGYSSLSYLQRFPVDYLKIDKSFVDDLGNMVRRPTLSRAVIEIAHSLELDVVAEGIERPEQLRELQGMGCGFGQGYLFAKPLDAHDMGSFIMGGPVAAVAGPSAGVAAA